MLLYVTRRNVLFIWYNPNLQKLYGIGVTVVEFTVTDTCTGRHFLHITRADDRFIAFTVFMRQTTA